MLFRAIATFLFHRVARKPISETVIEIVQCPHWIPTVTFDVELVLLKKKNTLVSEIQRFT